jgi:hypothetical protein
VLQQANGANLRYLLASDTYAGNKSYTGDPFEIQQLTIDCDGARNTAAATDGLVIHSWQTKAEDLDVLNCRGDGILVTNTTPNGTTLASTQVNGVISDDYIENSGQSGVYVNDSGNSVTDWHLTNNFIAGSGRAAIHLDNAAGWYIDGNHLYGDGGDGIYANRLFGTSIASNYIEDFGRAGGSTAWYGIEATVQGGSASTITGNRVFMYQPERPGSRYVYIAITRVNYGTGYVTVADNDIVGRGTAADLGFSYSAGTRTALRVTSVGNLAGEVTGVRFTGAGVTLSAGI